MDEELKRDDIPETGPGAAVDRVIGVEGGTHPEPAEEWATHTRPAAGEAAPAEHVHSEHSFWPLVTALSLLIIGVGLLSQPILVALGAMVLMVALVGWLWEPWTS